MINQSDVKICIVKFDYKEDKIKLFSKLCEVLINSIKNHLPDVEIELHEIEGPDHNNYNGHKINRHFASNSIKLKIWNDVIQNTNKHVVLLDCDTLVVDNFLEVFDEDFDIGITFRDKPNAPYNGGVIFVKPTNKSKQFFKLFLEINNSFMIDTKKHKIYDKKYTGYNQAALGCILEEYNNDNKFKIKEFPCNIYNLCNNYNTYTYINPKIIHIKMKLREDLQNYLVYNNYNNITQINKTIIKLWNTYNINESRKIVVENTMDNIIKPDNNNIKEIKHFVKNSLPEKDWLNLIKEFNNTNSTSKNFNVFILKVYRDILKGRIKNLKLNKIQKDDITMNKNTNPVKKLNRSDVILKLIQNIKNPIGVEIGIWQGETFFKLLNENKDLYLYGVDPYRVFKGGDSISKKTQDYWDTLYNEIIKKTNDYKDRCEIYRNSSLNVAEIFKNENKQFDFIFIDGNHLDVGIDIDAWYPLVKDNGIIIGHDYIHHKLGDYVKKIVDKKFEDRTIYTGRDCTWWIYK